MSGGRLVGIIVGIDEDGIKDGDFVVKEQVEDEEDA